jgi:hypothetical protein
MQAFRQRPEIGIVGGYDETIDRLAVDQIHRVDGEPNVRGILASGKSAALSLADVVADTGFRPCFGLQAAEIAVGAPHNGATKRCEFIKDTVDRNYRNVFGIEQDCQTKVCR